MFDTNIDLNILQILKRYVFKRMNAKTCLLELKILGSACGKKAQTANLIKITLENRSHPIKIQKIVAFHYKDRFRRFVRKPNKGPINITRRDLFPLSLEPWQHYTLHLNSTDFYGTIPTNGFLLFKIYPHSDRPIKKMLDLSREKIEQYIEPYSKKE